MTISPNGIVPRTVAPVSSTTNVSTMAEPAILSKFDTWPSSNVPEGSWSSIVKILSPTQSGGKLMPSSYPHGQIAP